VILIAGTLCLTEAGWGIPDAESLLCWKFGAQWQDISDAIRPKIE